MALREGAKTVVGQCLNVQDDEHVVVVNDGNDPNLIDALMTVLDSRAGSYDYMEYEPRDRSGEEPPERVASAMEEADVFIAPTKRSLSHTAARRTATDAGARGATMPGVNKQMWTTSLLADYEEVAALCQAIDDRISKAATARIETPSGTRLSFDVVPEYYIQGTGLIHEAGEWGNLPAGETFGAPVNASGRLVIDHFPHAPEGTVIEIRENRAVSIKHPGNEESHLAEIFDTVDGGRNVAEFGVGANPKAELIGNTLQDEKVLGTVHIAFGDNSSMVPPGDGPRVEAAYHMDAVCESPTVWLDGEKLLDDGEPLFR